MGLKVLPPHGVWVTEATRARTTMQVADLLRNVSVDVVCIETWTVVELRRKNYDRLAAILQITRENYSCGVSTTVYSHKLEHPC